MASRRRTGYFLVQVGRWLGPYEFDCRDAGFFTFLMREGEIPCLGALLAFKTPANTLRSKSDVTAEQASRLRQAVSDSHVNLLGTMLLSGLDLSLWFATNNIARPTF